MRNPIQRRLLCLLSITCALMLAFSLVLGVSGGCQQAATAQTAYNAIQAAPQIAQSAGQATTQAAQVAGDAISSAANAVGQIPGVQLALNLVPQTVLNTANQILNGNKLNWGQPKEVVYYDGVYVLVYPNGSAQPHLVVIDTLGSVARLQRLEHSGY